MQQYRWRRCSTGGCTYSLRCRTEKVACMRPRDVVLRKERLKIVQARVILMCCAFPISNESLPQPTQYNELHAVCPPTVLRASRGIAQQAFPARMRLCLWHVGLPFVAIERRCCVCCVSGRSRRSNSLMALSSTLVMSAEDVVSLW